MLDVLQLARRSARHLKLWAKTVWEFCSVSLCLLAACQPAQPSSALFVPIATPHILAVQVTPALQSLRAKFHACADEQPNTGLVLTDTPAVSIDLDQAAVGLQWGPSTKTARYAAELGQEALVVIVPKGSANQTLALADLQAVYQGKLRDWPGTSKEIHAWTYPSGDDAAEVFQSVILGGGKIAPNAVYTAPDPEAMVDAVSKDPNAVGYLPGRWLKDGVDAVHLQGIDTAALRQPIIAISKSEPEGPEKSWLLCLQQGLSE